MKKYKVFNNVDRKMIQIESGYCYLVDFICLEKRNGKPDKYLAIGYETQTNKHYGWVEICDDDPVEAFVSYVKVTDEIEGEELAKKLDKKHS
ncbi:hypothetical protein [Siminovitchia sp. FSL W7-1587]|uniref:hypothetical protein n=1 Tax=Siminovitchia sp. FSL W7-1587 TaxID=2954699 RepID=UPI0030CFAE4D